VPYGYFEPHQLRLARVGFCRFVDHARTRRGPRANRHVGESANSVSMLRWLPIEGGVRRLQSFAPTRGAHSFVRFTTLPGNRSQTGSPLLRARLILMIPWSDASQDEHLHGGPLPLRHSERLTSHFVRSSMTLHFRDRCGRWRE
jgi:hypothetical protein